MVRVSVIATQSPLPSGSFVFNVKVTSPTHASVSPFATTKGIEVVLLSLNDFREKIRTGKMTDTETAYLGLDYLKLL